VLLSGVLFAFALDFERESQTPTSLCANAIRVLSDESIPETEMQHKPYIIVERNPERGRGKFVRLSEAGIKTHQTYYSRTRDIEKKWKKHFHTATKKFGNRRRP
jgi:DNA-binding MarR family transcriptional regulator